MLYMFVTIWVSVAFLFVLTGIQDGRGSRTSLTVNCPSTQLQTLIGTYLLRISSIAYLKQTSTILGDHMIGHVYCKFTDEEDASDALQVMDGRYYDGRKMEVEFSPVLNFQEVRKITAY